MASGERGVRLLPSSLDRRGRRVYGSLIGFFAVVFVSLLWPVYPLFAAARPLIAGLPLSLFYLAAILVTCFLVLLGLYRWESATGRLDVEDGGEEG